MTATIEVIDIRDLLPSQSGYTGRYIIKDLDQIEGISVHHSVSGGDWGWLARDRTQREEIQHLRAIDVWHNAPNNDWGGFGYHMAAFSSGRAYLVGSLNTGRAHTAGLNNRFLGLVVIGTFTERVPIPLHIRSGYACVELMRAYVKRNLPVVAHRRIRGQRTVCPGNKWKEWVHKVGEEPQPEVVVVDDFLKLRGKEIGYMIVADAAHHMTQTRQMELLSLIRHSKDERPAAEALAWRKLHAAYNAENQEIVRAIDRCLILGRGD